MRTSKDDSRRIEINFERLEPIYSQGYPNELMQVILNIINNARDAIQSNHPTYTNITLDVEVVNNRIKIKISD